MRLSEVYKKAIVQSFKDHFPIDQARIFLYGSRTDSKKKGGDIDLLIVVTSLDILENKLQTILSFERQIKNKIGEQKIDTSVVTDKEFNNNEKPFLEVIKPDLINLLEH